MTCLLHWLYICTKPMPAHVFPQIVQHRIIWSLKRSRNQLVPVLMPYSSNPVYTEVASAETRQIATELRDEVMSGTYTRAEPNDQTHLTVMSNSQVTVANFNAAKSQLSSRAQLYFNKEAS